MTDAKRLLIGGFVFYLLAVGLLIGSTVGHEYSHYVAHEGFQPAPIQFYETPADAQAALVGTETAMVDGRSYRVENVEKTTIVIYRDTLVYAFTLNLAPMALYTDGTLGATYMHTDGQLTASRVTGADDHDGHWNGVMGAPIGLAIGGLLIAIGWVAFTRSLASRAFLYAYASEVGNNAHHAADLGLDATIYSIIAQVLFGIAIIATVLLSATYRAWMSSPPTGRSSYPAATPRFQRFTPAARNLPTLRFRHARPTGRAPIHPTGYAQPAGTL